MAEKLADIIKYDDDNTNTTFVWKSDIEFQCALSQCTVSLIISTKRSFLMMVLAIPITIGIIFFRVGIEFTFNRLIMFYSTLAHGIFRAFRDFQFKNIFLQSAGYERKRNNVENK